MVPRNRLTVEDFVDAVARELGRILMSRCRSDGERIHLARHITMCAVSVRLKNGQYRYVWNVKPLELGKWANRKLAGMETPSAASKDEPQKNEKSRESFQKWGIKAYRSIVPVEGASEIINVNSRDPMCEKHSNNPRWRNFVVAIHKNGFIRETLLERQDGICPYCGQPLGATLTLHHLDYDHECYTDALVGNNIPSRKTNRIYHRLAPPCQSCKQSEECLKRIRLVHGGCNAAIAVQRYLNLGGTIPDEEEPTD